LKWQGLFVRLKKWHEFDKILTAHFTIKDEHEEQAKIKFRHK